MIKKLPEKLIIWLIADDLINFRLINRLAKINRRAYAYLSQNSIAVFEIMGFEEASDYEHYSYYLERRHGVKNISQAEPNRDPFLKLAEDIYNELERRASEK
jgi:hypothetical protein